MRPRRTNSLCKTTEQAESVLEHLSQCEKSAKETITPAGRKKPIKWMDNAAAVENRIKVDNGSNQDAGYGLGDCCVSYCNADGTSGSESSSYGVSGLFISLISQEEKDNPPLVDRGVPAIRIRCDDCVNTMDLCFGKALKSKAL